MTADVVTCSEDLGPWAAALGKLVNSLQSLEFVLRVFLAADARSQDSSAHGHDPYDSPEGSIVPLDPFTDYAQLRELVRRYNAAVAAVLPALVIDPGVVRIRDALAHGRVSAASPSQALRLIKYSPPRREDPTTVTVQFSVQLTEDWLRGQMRAVQNLTLKVVEAHERLHLQ